MSAEKLMATTLWTQLVNAMRQDEMIAHCIVQAGPATAAVIMDTVRQVQQAQYPWLSADIKPQAEKQVLGIDIDGHVHLLRWNGGCSWFDSAGEWHGDIVKWRYFDLPPKDGV